MERSPVEMYNSPMSRSLQ